MTVDPARLRPFLMADERETIERLANVIRASCLPATAGPHQEDLRRAFEIMMKMRERGIREALRISDEAISKARKAVQECDPWSPAQAEWSRSRDLAIGISEEIEKLVAPPALVATQP